MNTKIFTKNELSEAAAMIRNGGIVVMPTETVYGLAANVFDPEAVEKVFQAKGRQPDNPLIVHIANNSDWEKLVEEIPQKARQLADRFWPGPLTIILKKKSVVPDIVSGGLDTVAVRMPKNKIAFRFIRECGCPLAAPSANLSGCPSPTKFNHVLKDMDGRVDGIIEGGDCMVGVESTVISLVDDKPVILRPGRITAQQISKVIGEVEIHSAVKSDLAEGEKAPSPGMKYKHYAPKAQVRILDGSDEQFIKYVKDNADDNTAVICFNETLEALADYNTFALGAKDDSVAQAKKLFDVLRAVDDAQMSAAFAPLPSDKGVGLAVNNRLLRAAGFNVIKIGQTPQKEEQNTITTKKAVKDKKPDSRPKKEPKPAEQADDSVQVIGLDNYEDVEPDFENADIKPDIKEEIPQIKPETPVVKKGKKYKQNKKKEKRREQQIKKEKLSQESLEKVEFEQEVEENDDFEIFDAKQANAAEENDESLKALGNITFTADFNDDFSKEISENIEVIDPEEESKNPLKRLTEVIINKDDDSEKTDDDELEEKEEQPPVKKEKKSFFKKLFVRKSAAEEQTQQSEPKTEIVKEKKASPAPAPIIKEPKPADNKKEIPAAAPKENKKEKKENKKKDSAKDNKPSTAEKTNQSKKEPEQSKPAKPAPQKQSAAKPVSEDKDAPDALSNRLVNPDNTSEPQKQKDVAKKVPALQKETEFVSNLSAEDIKFEDFSYEKFNKENAVKQEPQKQAAKSSKKKKKQQKQTKKDNSNPAKNVTINELGIDLIKEASGQPDKEINEEAIASNLAKEDIKGIQLDVKEEKPESILSDEANISAGIDNIRKINGIKVVGITGKTGAGKGLVTQNLAGNKKDCAVIDADKLYHALLQKENMEVSLVFTFGRSILSDKGGVDRKKLAAVAFSSRENIKKLNYATHPYVAREIITLIESAKKNGINTVYLDAPTLIESGLYRICDELIFVRADKATRKKRIIERDGLSEAEAEQRMKLEKDDKFYLKYATKVVNN